MADPLLALGKRPTKESETKQARRDLRKRGTAILVAEDGGRVVGFIELLLKRNARVFKIRRYGYINSCVVEEKRRRSGIGRALVRGAITFFRREGISQIKLNTYSSNLPALEFWKNNGFGEISKMMIRKA